MENAYEYLKKFKDSEKCDIWLSKVIETFLHMNPDEQINSLAEDLLDINEYVVSYEKNNEVVVRNDSVVINELIHKTGVNALAENQKIRFNPQVNVIYGLNGTGKSSYFRIFNEMLGGHNETPILSNIYSDEVKPISVEMKCTYMGSNKILNWNGDKRGLPELRSMRVFDSAYTKDLLKKRNSDELVVKPYGLNVFADLISYIDKILEVANEIICKKEHSKPLINKTNMLDEIAGLFDEDIISKENITIIRNIFNSTKIVDGELESKLEEVNNLREKNPKDKVEIQRVKVSELDKIKKHIECLVEKGNLYISLVRKNIDAYNELKQQSDAHKKELEILKDIPGTDSKLWHEFVAKGVEYVKEQDIQDECPFCHQKYSGNSKEILFAYFSYLDNKSQIELGNVEKNLYKINSELDKWSVLYNIDKASLEITEKCESAINSVEEIRIRLLNMIENKKAVMLKQIDMSDLLSEINTSIQKILVLIENLSADSEKKNMAIMKCQEEYKKLNSDYSVKLQQDKIEELINTQNWLTEKKEILSNVSGYKMKISTLSKKAHNELLTTQLQDEFNRKLKNLGVKNIEIELQGKNSNGVQQTELMIKKQKEITSILSEGEQKATALALYLSEIALSKNRSTIIFDDPVNSLDHKMMQGLADLLMNLDNQIIVFTHNKLFLDCFECSKFGHICKTINSACNSNKTKHVYLYETKSEGVNLKGVILEKQSEKLEAYLKELEKMLKDSPFTKFDDACSKLRRGVEFAIDEIVFNNQRPTKLSNKNSRINWDKLKKICSDNDLIDDLHSIHARVSGGQLHNGLERDENPLEREEIEELYNNLNKWFIKKKCGNKN